MKGWRADLFKDWMRITGVKVKINRPRHSPDEMRRLFASLHDPRIDPRFGLAFDLGGEQRVGQVLRCLRSDLDLTIVALDAITTSPAGKLGVLHVTGDGKKLASPIMLTASQRAAVDGALAGYLSHYENAYRAGEISDYPLFPAGRTKEGRSKLVPNPKPLSRDAARKMFMELEEVAGVVHVPGRCWYGVRRVATDLAEDVTTDERVLNSITGHKDSATRRLYQESERMEILRGAAETREKVRRGTVAESAPTTSYAAKNSA